MAAPEVSTLTDLASSFENVSKMQPVPYDRGAIAGLVVAIILPMVPVVLAEIPFVVVVKALLHAVK
jgi:hypothetical protein